MNDSEKLAATGEPILVWTKATKVIDPTMFMPSSDRTLLLSQVLVVKIKESVKDLSALTFAGAGAMCIYMMQ